MCRELIVRAYGEYKHDVIYGDENGIYCESKIYDTVEFGYNKIVVERPLRNDKGELILKKGKKQPDVSLRDTENVPLVEDVDTFFSREVLPFAPDAWIDTKKTKVGYEIPMARYFYKYKKPEAIETVVERIMELEKEITVSLTKLFHKEG